jgi:hypothetical protein
MGIGEYEGALNVFPGTCDWLNRQTLVGFLFCCYWNNQIETGENANRMNKLLVVQELFLGRLTV